ncbi:MAG: class I SAM-dependent methyltransferase [Sideroxydans sp.]
MNSVLMQCPCASHREPLLTAYDKGETDFRICPDCGIAFRERFPTKDELEEIYRLAYAKENISGRNTNQESGSYAAKSYADFILNNLWVSGARVLDYGAGSGELVEYLRENGVDATGLEFSDNARQFCRLNRGFDLLADLSEIPDGHFQVVSMVEVVEHLTDLPASLNELRRVMAPGASILVTTPNRKGLRARLQKGFWREAQKKFHLFLFDQDSLEFHLKASGFDEVKKIRFSPRQRATLKYLISARLMQALGLFGSLCVVAKRPKRNESEI